MVISSELNESIYEKADLIFKTEELEPDELVEYILLKYHKGIKELLPKIQEHLEKVASVHGQNHPELREALNLFTILNEGLIQLFGKKERTLFPYIILMAEASRNKAPKPVPSCFDTVNKPIAVMLHGHDSALELIEEMKELLSDFEAPEDACTTYKVTLKELSSLAEDLQKSFLLENETLFPKVKALEKLFSL